MFRKTFTGTLVAASLTAGALMTLPSASAAPTFVKGGNISGTAALPHRAVVAMSADGDSAAAWIRDGRIVANSAEKGSWVGAEYVTDPGENVSDPAIAMNDVGDAVLSWVQEDADGDIRLAGARMNSAGDFVNPTFLSADDWFPIDSVPDVGLSAGGTFFAAYEDSNNGNVHEVRVTSWTQGGTLKNFAVSDLSAHGGSIAVNSAGQALVAFHDDINGSEVVETRRFDPGTGLWSQVRSVGLVGNYDTDTDVSLADNGFGTVVYTKQDNGHFRAMANVSKPDATLGGQTFISPAGYDAAHLSISENATNAALIAYDRVGNGHHIAYNTRSTNGSWSTSKIVEDALPGLTRPHPALSDAGFQVVAWDEDEHQKALWRASSFADMTPYDSGSVKFRPDETGLAVDSQGNALLTGVIHSADPTEGFVTAKFLDAAGPVATMTAPGANTIGTTVPVSWTALDRFSNLGTSDVRVRTAYWNGNFAGYAYAAQDVAGSSLQFEGLRGRTYCFQTRTQDAVGNSGAFAPERCTTTPLDDGVLIAADGFTRVKASQYYNGTVSTAKTKGANLRVVGVRAKRLALLVSRVKTGGTIDVYFQGKKLGSYSLKGSSNKQVIVNKTFEEVETGTVVVKVTSPDGRTVRIDGLIAAK